MSGPASSPPRDYTARVSFDPSTLFVSLIVSGLGFALFHYGRKQMRMPQLVAGVVLMVYPYFVSSVLGMLLVGAGVVGLLWLALRLDW